ncbi:dUTP diphosphatase [Bacillus amyloliquefaciens]|uniref:dUTP diphosphatase n=1 Tax=Bacillus amyloliquefaciens TaxID=1390 RepID=UPI000E59BB78|nr:dUTP diphosphatase [Bacillus amyloliquefaciens]MCY7425321.1 dUTP diphosphatase [Bacillus amyloliquefaciens]MEC0967305.1 dUTP diphosphatase [Bacillus amyloliquefaciens]MEC1015912.1 dUTP diphosphatase [Bacillus amyloliquefaciens]MEC2264635.1 dUTP diphosphatase [Bacillus amyloliquefaciens]RHX67589.1 dUTPase [Bacillus amyloliquefaciens]
MNLQKMFEMQKVLDDRIIKEKGLEGQDLLPNLILALQVELAECANEWRGFKHWSNNQKPRTKVSTNVGANPENAAFFRCENHYCGENLNKDDFKHLLDPDYEICPVCNVGDVTAFRDKNPLLEEYVDCLHFILSIGNRLGLNDTDTIDDVVAQHLISKKGFGTAKTFSCLLSIAYGFHFSNVEKRTYISLFTTFFELGSKLGFKWEQIEAAYMDKNAINHQRQQEGY